MAKIKLTKKIVQDVLQQDVNNLCLLDTNGKFYSATHSKELAATGNLRHVHESMMRFIYTFDRPFTSDCNNVLVGVAVMQTKKADMPSDLFEFIKSPTYSETGNCIVGRAISYNKTTGKYEATPAGWFNVGTFQAPFFNGRRHTEGLLSTGMFHFLNYVNQDDGRKRFMQGYER